MPWFFFDTFDGRELIRDEEGEEMSGPDDMRRQAIADVRELVAGVIARGGEIDSRELRVRDEAGRLVLAIPYMDLVAGRL